MTEKEALKLALEALEVATTPLAKDRQEVLRAITAIREALADHIGDANKMVEQSTCKQALQVEQPAQQQEPFCYHDGRDIVGKEYADHSDVFPLYTAPKPRQWVGLTQQDMKLALKTLEKMGRVMKQSPDTEKAIVAIRKALAEQPAQQQRWAVFCSQCRKEWSVSYPHPGKSICAECDAKVGAQQQKEGFASPGGGYVPAIPRPIPLDWKLVPRKATPEMLRAMDECAQEGYDERLYEGMASSVYMAAWDASPVLGTLPPSEKERSMMDIIVGNLVREGINKHRARELAEHFVKHTSPPASKPWVGLTQQDIDIAFDDTQEGGGFNEFARAIEAKLRESNEHREKNA